MSDKPTSKSCTKWIEAAPVRDVIIEETTTSNIYWDVSFEFEFSKYTEEDSRLSHALIMRRENDGSAVGLIDSWAPRGVFGPDDLSGCDESAVKDFLGFRTKTAWMYQAVHCAPLDEFDARILDRRAGESVVCVWRFYHDEDNDLVLGQRIVLTGGYANYSRRPLLPDVEGEISEREETSRSSA